MLSKFIILISLLALVNTDVIPVSYNFGYNIDGPFDSRSREETRDESGKVTGSYRLRDADGRQRLVTYTADKAGFKANVNTNEHGTLSKSPADIQFISSQSELHHDPAQLRYTPNYFRLNAPVTSFRTFSLNPTLTVPSRQPYLQPPTASVIRSSPYSYESNIQHIPTILPSRSFSSEPVLRPVSFQLSPLNSNPFSYSTQVKHEIPVKSSEKLPVYEEKVDRRPLASSKSGYKSSSHSTTLYAKKSSQPLAAPLYSESVPVTSPIVPEVNQPQTGWSTSYSHSTVHYVPKLLIEKSED